ncbi:MAG: hypothetical protein HXS54_01775 [Theionarchaea archaeon]|nr:hypothetical protein [Theionarchaea archaeon]
MEIGNLTKPIQHRNERKKVDKVCSIVWTWIVDESRPVPGHEWLYKNQKDGCWGCLVQDYRLLISAVRFDVFLMSPVMMNVHLNKRYPIKDMSSRGDVFSWYAEYFFSGWSA